MNPIADAVLKSKTRAYVNVSLPFGKFRLRSMTVGELADFRLETDILLDHLSRKELNRLSAPRMASWSLVNENDELVFPPPDIDVLEKASAAKTITECIASYYELATTSAAIIGPLNEIAMKLNGLSEAARVEIEKN